MGSLRSPLGKRLHAVPLSLSAGIVGLLTLEIFGIVWLGTSLAGSILANLIQTAASLLAAICCLRARHRALGLARYFWTLVSLGFLTWAFANLAWMCFEDVLRIPIPSPSFVHFLFDIWGGFFAMALFLGDERDATGLDSRTLLDFLQIAVVFSFLYFDFYYIPALNMTFDSALLRESIVSGSESFALVLLALIRMKLVRSSVLRSLYLGAAVYLAAFTLSSALADYGQSYKKIPTGSWYDLGWTLPFLFASVLASLWQQPEKTTMSDLGSGVTLSKVAAGNLMLGLAPLFIAVEAVRLEGKWAIVGILTVCLSGACYSFRLILDEYAEARNARNLRDSLTALRASEEKYHSFIIKSSEGIFRLRFDPPIPAGLPAAEQAELCFKSGLLAECNDAFAQMYGCSSAQGMAEKRLSYMWSPDDLESKRMLERFVANAYQVSDFEVRRSANRKAQVFRTSMTGFVDNGGLVQAWGIQLDVTERATLEEQFRQAQKMEVLGRLASGVAHDFNNILTVIVGYSDLSLVGIDEANPLAQNISQIKSAADYASSLTRQLLVFSRQQVVFPRSVDLNAVVSGVQKMLARVVGEDVSISFTPAVPLDLIKADAGQIEQVLMNLVVNARDALPRGGQIFCKTENAELEDGFAQDQTPVAAGRYVMLSVSDTGTGMSEETKAKIFEPFFTTKEPGKGTGLGLSTVYGIVRQAGGYIWVYSEVGKGSTFKVYFPRLEGEEERQHFVHRYTATVGGSETILLAEDDGALRKMTAALLGSVGYRVLEAKDAASALDLAMSQDAKIDLLLTDIIMPGMSGMELSTRMTRSLPEIKVLYMSGYTGERASNREQLQDPKCWLEKPFTRNILFSKVRNLLDTPAS